MRSLSSIAALLCAGIANAQSIDPYDPAPSGPVASLALQADGKVIVVGNFFAVGGTTRGRVARLNIDGTPDTSFADAEVDSEVKTLAVQPDGKIVIGGGFSEVSGATRHDLARLNADGTLDTSFADPNLDNTVWTLALQPDGKIMIGGDFGHIGAAAQDYVARIDANGGFDGSFANPNLCCLPVRSIAVQADGRVLVGGAFSHVGDVEHFYFARFSAGGVFDPSFPNIGRDIGAGSIVVAPDASIFVLELGAEDVLKLTPSGTLASGFTSAVADGTIDSVTLQPNGKLVVAGIFQTVGGQPRHALARLNSNGSLDTTFADLNFSLDGGNPNGYVYGIAAQADGRVVAIGNFSLVDGQSRNLMARVDTGDYASSALVVEPGSGNVTVFWYRGGDGPELALPPSLEHSIDGVNFTVAGSMARVANGWRITAPYDVHGTRFYLRAIGTTSNGAGNGSPGQVASEIYSSDTIFHGDFE